MPTVEVIDDLPKRSFDRKMKIADYLAFDRSLVIEQKTITTDQAQKVQDILDSYEGEDFYPQFYGKRSLDLILEKFPNAQEVHRTIYTMMLPSQNGSTSTVPTISVFKRTRRQLKNLVGTSTRCLVYSSPVRLV